MRGLIKRAEANTAGAALDAAEREAFGREMEAYRNSIESQDQTNVDVDKAHAYAAEVAKPYWEKVDKLNQAVTTPKQPAAAVQATTPSVAKTSPYTIKDGDTLSAIAARYKDPSITADSIARMNNIQDPNKIRAGATLQLPLLKTP